MVAIFRSVSFRRKKIELQDIMKDVLPDMSKGYSDKLESKVIGAIAAIMVRNRFDLRFDTSQGQSLLVKFISLRIFMHIFALRHANVSEIMSVFVHFFASLVDVFFPSRTAIMQPTGPAEAHADERR